MLKVLLISLLASLACAGTDIKVIQDDREGFAFEAAFDPPALSEVSAKGARFSVIAMKDLQTHSIPKEPQVPCRNFLIGVPPGAYQVSFSFGNASGISLKHPPLPGESYGPRQGRRLPEIIYAPDPRVYSSAQYPGHPGVIWKESRMGSQRVLHLTVFPVVYSPLKQSLACQGLVRVTVRFSPSGGVFQTDAAYEGVLSRGLLNYKTAQGFRIRPPGLRKALSAKGDWPFSGIFTNIKIYKINIRSSSEFSMDGEGFYRVTGSELQAAGGVLQGDDVGDIRVYAPSYGIALKAAYSPGVEDSAALVEVPCEIVDYDNDMVLDGNDQIRFYAQGGAAFLPTDSGWEFRNHPFDFYNHYWVMLNMDASASTAKRLDTLSRDSTYDRRVESFPERIHRESNTYNPFRAGESYRVMWVWGDQMRVQGISLSDPIGGYLYNVADATVRIRPRVVTASGDLRIDTHFMIKLNNDTARGVGDRTYESSALNIGGANTVHFGYDASGSSSDRYFMDGYDVIYNRRLSLGGGMLQFYGRPGRDTLFGYAVSGFSGNAICLDVSNPLRPAYVRSLRRGDTAVVLSPGFLYGRDTLRGRKLCVLTEAGLKAPSSVEWYSNAPRDGAQRNLRDPSVKFDYAVVCPLDFYTAARQLARHRSDFPGDAVPPAKAVVVFVEDIYSQFAGGKTDISAIRNFLMFAHKYWNLRYAVLMGSGHFDFKGYMQVSRPNFIPPYEAFVDSTLLYTPMLRSAGGATDDFYGAYDADTSSPQVFVGRLPAGSADEALVMVNKIIRAETDATISKEWRNRVLFMADDDQQLTIIDEVNSSLAHMDVTEKAAAYFPLSMERSKVYLQEYEVNPVTREKPDAELALVDRINEGVLFWIFVGHGAFDKLTSESVFSLQYTLPRLKNVGKYGFFWAASCNVGEFDNPFEESVCMKLLAANDVGMSASVGASRLTNASPNRDLLHNFIKAVFDSTAPAPVSIGQALALAKSVNLLSSESNNRVYNLFGDPASYLYPDFGTLALDNPAQYDTLRALQKLTVSGAVSDPQVCNGNIYIRLSGPDEIKEVDYEVEGGSRSIGVLVPGTVLNSTIGPVQNGRFSVNVIVPKSIPFATSGGRLSFFSWYGGRIAAKSVENIFFSADMPDSIDFDTVGPKVTLYVNSGGSNSLDFSSAPAGESFTLNRKSLITVVLDDPDGIRTNGSLVNEGLLYEMPGLFDRRRVSSVNTIDGYPSKRYFTLSMETELMGVTADLTGQSYELVVLAQDNYDNRTRKAFRTLFAKDSLPGLSSREVFAYPNPFTDSTRIIWRTATPSDVTVNIYTQSGRLIRVLKSRDVTGSYAEGANSLWDGRDEARRLAARGIYFFSISFTTSRLGTDADKENFTEKAPQIGKMMKY